MPRPTGIVQAEARLDGKQWEQKLQDLQGRTQTFVSSTRSMSLALAGGFAGASVAMGALTVGLKRAGDVALGLRKNLSGAFNGGELDQVAAKISEISSLELKGLDEDELVEGAKRLGTFSDQVAADLQRVANVSAKTGETFGTLKDSFAEFTVNPAAQDNLREIADIKPDDLVKFGAVLDATGQRILTTGKYAEGAQAALRAVVDSKYGGAAAEMASNTDKLNSGLKLLSQEIGVSVATSADNAAGALLPLVDRLRALPVEVKAAVGVGSELATFLLSAGSAGITASVAFTDLAANVKNLGGAAKIVSGFGASMATFAGYTVSAAPAVATLTSAATGLTGSAQTSAAAVAAAEQAVIGFATGAAPATQATITLGQAAKAASLQVLALVGPYALVVAAAAGLYAVGNKLIKQSYERERAEKAAIATQQAALKIQKDKLDLQGKSAKQLYDEGKTVEQLMAVLADYRADLEVAKKSSNDATVARLQEVIEGLQQEVEVLRGMEQRDRDNFQKSGSTALAKDLNEANALIDYQRAQNKITEEQAIKLKKDAAKKFIADEQERKMALLALDTEAANLRSQAEREADEKVASDREKAREEAFANEIHRIEKLRAENQITEADALAQKKKAIEAYGRDPAEARANELEQINQAAADKLEADNKVEAARKDKLQKELARIELLRTEGKISADKERELLFSVLGTFKLTEDERTKIILKRAQIAKTQREKEAAEEKAAADKKAADDAKAAEDAARLAQENADDLADAQAKGRDLKAQTSAGDVERLQQQTEGTGKDNRSSIKAQIEEQLRLRTDSIKVEAERAAAATKSAEARVQIERNAAEQLQLEILSTAEEYEDAMKRQTDALDAFRKKQRGESSFGGGYGVEEFADRLRAEQATTVRGGTKAAAPPISFGTLNNLSDVIRRGQTGYSTLPPDLVSGITGKLKESVTGDIGIHVTTTTDANGLPTAKVETTATGFGGNYSIYEKSGRGMKGRPGAR